MEEEKLEENTVVESTETIVEDKKNKKERKAKKEKKQKDEKVKTKGKLTVMDITKRVLAFCAILMLILPMYGTLIFYLMSA